MPRKRALPVTVQTPRIKRLAIAGDNAARSSVAENRVLEVDGG